MFPLPLASAIKRYGVLMVVVGAVVALEVGGRFTPERDDFAGVGFGGVEG